VQLFSQLQTIFERTKEYIGRFMDLIQPIVDTAQDEHTKLYYHHILEEEEQRLGRLDELIPYLRTLITENKAEHLSDRELSRLLSDINLERFGLHNFREHLELSLYEFADEERRQLLNSMREQTQTDYLRVKEIMSELSEFLSDTYTVKLTDHDEGHEIHQVDHLKASSSAAEVHVRQEAKQAPAKKGLTVGSLRNVSF
jgi:hypothetical protein